MKKKGILSALFALLFFIGLVLPGSQKVEIIHNPADPLLGEITLEMEQDLVLGSETDDNCLFYRIWDVEADEKGNIYVLDSGATRIQKYDNNGKFLQTIGRKGQGPGEFERPISLCFDKKNLYVSEMVKIHMFDPNGKFVRGTKVPFFYMDFAADGEGQFVVTGRITVEGAQNLGVLILDPEGKTDKGFVYGYNREYKLYIADWTGKSILIIEKEVTSNSISNKEKNKIIDSIMKNAAETGLGWSKSVVEKMANLPKHRPIFDRIKADDEGRIYVRRRKSVLDDSTDMIFDIFGNDGYFLYTTKLPFVPMCIRDGRLYHVFDEEETGEVKVIRYRIKNWDMLASSRN